MMEWWSGLSNRERMLVIGAGILAISIGLYQFVFTPLTESKAKAEQAWRIQALETRQTLNGLEQLGGNATNSGAAQPASSESLELLLSRTSNARGLDIIRIDTPFENARTVWMESVAPDLIGPWIYELENQYGTSVIALDLRKRSENGALGGSLTVMRGGSS